MYDVQVVHFTAHVNVTLGATKRKVNGRKVGSRKAAVVAAAAAVAAEEEIGTVKFWFPEADKGWRNPSLNEYLCQYINI